MNDITNLPDVPGDHHSDPIRLQLSRHLVEGLGGGHIDEGHRFRVDDDRVNLIARAAPRISRATGAALAKNSPPSILNTVIPSIRRLSGCRSRSEK